MRPVVLNLYLGDQASARHPQGSGAPRLRQGPLHLRNQVTEPASSVFPLLDVLVLMVAHPLAKPDHSLVCHVEGGHTEGLSLVLTKLYKSPHGWEVAIEAGVVRHRVDQHPRLLRPPGTAFLLFQG